MVSTNKGQKSMTALQDWLSYSPVTPDAIKAVIRDAWRGLTMDDTTDDKGIDIVITMDLSGSMRAVYDGDMADVPGQPKPKNGEKLTRIETAKAVVKDFISRRKSDRIGWPGYRTRPCW